MRGFDGLSHRIMALVLALTATVAGCDDDADRGRTLTVLAAASLTETFERIADEFEAGHDGVSVSLAFDSSATLAEQVNQGAPADVLATADRRTMRSVAAQGNTAAEPRVFATNRLALVVPPENPAGITQLADLDDPGVDYVVCVESAPCGALARTVLDAAGITHDPASAEVDVKAVLTKVELAEADAGLVYATDAAAAGEAVRSLDVPAPEGATNAYAVAPLAGTDSPGLAREWVQLVLSDNGRSILGAAGFGAP